VIGQSSARPAQMPVARCERGSASLEAVALLPALILVGALVLQLGVTIWTTVAADTAARSAARAVTLHGIGAMDPAARTSLPGGLTVAGIYDIANGPDEARVEVKLEVPRVLPLGAFTVTRDAVMPMIP
jgi:pilus assembly protein CpaE